MKNAWMFLAIVFIWGAVSHSETTKVKRPAKKKPAVVAVIPSAFDLSKANTQTALTTLDRIRSAAVNPQDPSACSCRMTRLTMAGVPPTRSQVDSVQPDFARRSVYAPVHSKQSFKELNLYAVNEEQEFAATAGRVDDTHKMVGGAFRFADFKTSPRPDAGKVEARVYAGYGTTTTMTQTPVAQTKHNALLGLHLNYGFYK